MPLYLVVNSVRANAAQVKVTDTSDVDTADQTQIGSVMGGQRHLVWTQTGTAARRIVYVSKGGGLSFDTFVMARADRHVGHSFTLSQWSNYTTTKTDLVTSSNWAPTLVGVKSQDYIVNGLSVSNAQAVGITLNDGTGGAYTKNVSQLYFGSSFLLPSPLGFSTAPAWSNILINRQNYLVQETATLICSSLSLTQTQTLDRLYSLRSEPVFLYDSGGVWMADYLWHCIITDMKIAPAYHDFYNVTFNIARLRAYT